MKEPLTILALVIFLPFIFLAGVAFAAYSWCILTFRGVDAMLKAEGRVYKRFPWIIETGEYK